MNLLHYSTNVDSFSCELLTSSLSLKKKKREVPDLASPGWSNNAGIFTSQLLLTQHTTSLYEQSPTFLKLIRKRLLAHD